MSDLWCLGIFREQTHSPGREFDDAEILRLTGKHLEARGFQVSLKNPDEVSETDDQPPAFIFLMCERPAVLRLLSRYEARGVLQVNSPSAVLNTYRDRMIPLIEQAAIPFPRSVFVSTAAADPQVAEPVWVKRADVHNTQAGDVIFAPTRAAAQEALQNLAQRGIPQAVIQPNIIGDLIKFYGVGDPGHVPGYQPWFQWFYHKEQQLARYPFDTQVLAAFVQQAAAALGLEVYGGDAIATKEGAVMLIDLNAWPSFALYRDEASARIASYLEARFSRGSVR